jgi:hypothetical protein
MGWNIVDNNPSGSTTAGVCRGVQFYSTGGSDQYDVHVHDNIIRNAICDGLNLSTMNPDAGVVEAYNNVIYHSGTGPDPSDSSAAYSCINTGAFAAHTNNVEIYNNTLVDCGSRPGSYSSTGGMTLVIPTRLRDNIVYSVSSNEPYISTGSNPSLISGSNNLYFGNGVGPSQTTGNINADPQFVNLANYNYHVQSTSPAIQAGLSISSLLNSFDGIARPQTVAYDIGAYQAILGDLNGDGAVDCLDLNIVKASFGKKTGQAGFDPRADLNRDGLVDVRDLALVARQVPAGTVCQ